MKIPEALVEKVVADVSKNMKDPNYAQTAVGSFVESQPNASRFVTALAGDLGGTEAVVHVVFHAQVLAECFRRQRGRALAAIDFADLDRAHTTDLEAQFAKKQPALASYVASNVDTPKMREVLAHLALAFDAAS
jgi:hypothetical protein